MSGDLINGGFETVGALMILLNVRRLWRDKRLMGVHWAPTVFFTSWGLWNLFYYPSLHQWVSLGGGCFLVAVNLAWLASIAWFAAWGRPVIPNHQLNGDCA